MVDAMNIMCLGDVVGRSAVDKLGQKLWGLRSLWGVDMVIANGENASDGNGLLQEDAEALFSAGVDVITSGNHIYRRKEIYTYLDEKKGIIRPANYPAGCPGVGYTVFDNGVCSVLVINLMGLVYMDSLECPFHVADDILKKYEKIKIKIIDFHAEATAEKKALATYLDGRITALTGTHTHVQTSDACLLPKGTAFITDLGMSAPVDSILGVDKEQVLKKFLTKMPVRFERASGENQIQGAMIEINEKIGTACGIKAFSVM